jgi:hydroxymethylglutaryl-CoA synthase
MQPGYQDVLMTVSHKAQIEKRAPLTYTQYLAYHQQMGSADKNIVFDINNSGPYRLAGIKDHKRYYEKTDL